MYPQKIKESIMNKFTKDIQTIYDELASRQAILNGYFKLTCESHKEANDAVNDFLEFIGVERTSDSTMAALTRIVNLREDALEQVLSKMNFSNDEIISKKELAYEWVAHMHTSRHSDLLEWIEEGELLTPFYRTLLRGVHDIGVAMSVWQSEWTAWIIHNINSDLKEKFNDDDTKVFEFLTANKLLDCDELGVTTDRCYSALIKNESGEYQSLAYCEAFADEVAEVSNELVLLINELKKLKDDVYNQKDEWLAYFVAINEALIESDTSKLLTKWQNVDRTWMSITTPVQVGHPLEYYEDHYRKAVALEWDIRIVNPKLQHGSKTRANIIYFTNKLAAQMCENSVLTAKNNCKQVDKTQLYIGQPMLYYAAEFNGLFSAQVVPNDKVVSDIHGHKIFAYSDFVLASKLAKPIMKLGVEIMGEEFVRKSREFATNSPSLWHEVYDISTIGHEFGHILWLDEYTEGAMNVTGQFKNIEEFKATTGGLMAYFHNEKKELRNHLIDDLVSRSIGLMAWREVGEVLPYYCEGIIHLDILFASKLIEFDEKIIINYDRYDEMKELYEQAYKDLATHYISKMDANIYLSKYARKENGVYLPVNKKVIDFVEHYYERYKDIGQETILL
jgi:hypothetical protein